MVVKPQCAYKQLRVNYYSYTVSYYIDSMTPTCFGHTYGHLQGGELQRIYYNNVLSQCTEIPCICALGP